MSRLECIDDDMEEEIVLRIKNANLSIFPPDFDHEVLRLELARGCDIANVTLLTEVVTKTAKLLMDYGAVVMALSIILGLDLKAAEARMAAREAPTILKKMEGK